MLPYSLRLDTVIARPSRCFLLDTILIPFPPILLDSLQSTCILSSAFEQRGATTYEGRRVVTSEGAEASMGNLEGRKKLNGLGLG